MALVASLQRLAPLLSTTLTPGRPRMHIQRRCVGEPAVHPSHTSGPWGGGGISSQLWSLGAVSRQHHRRHSILSPAFVCTVPSIHNALSSSTS